MAARHAITSTRAPAKPLAENSLRAAERICSRVRSGSRALPFHLLFPVGAGPFIVNNPRDTTSNQTVTYPANDATAGRTTSFGPPIPCSQTVGPPTLKPPNRGRTSNVEHPTSNAEVSEDSRCPSMFGVGCSMLDVPSPDLRPPSPPLGEGGVRGRFMGRARV